MEPMGTDDVRPAVDFIGIGAARSATSWLANVLRTHPAVCLSDPKEIRYFNEHLIPVGPNRGKANPVHGRSIDWYEAHFAHARPHQIRGEFTPVYFCDEAAARNIHRHYPDIRLILSLRNPIDRAYSQYWQHRWLGFHTIPSFEDAIDLGFGYLELSLYARQLRRYLDYFALDQIHVSIFEELTGSPPRDLQRLCEFLGIAPVDPAELAGLHRNAGLSVRSPGVKTLVRAASQGLSSMGLGGLMRGMRKAGAQRIWHRLMSKPRENPPLAATTRDRLRPYFADDVAELEGMLGRDLSIWGIGSGRQEDSGG